MVVSKGEKKNTYTHMHQYIQPLLYRSKKNLKLKFEKYYNFKQNHRFVGLFSKNPK